MVWLAAVGLVLGALWGAPRVRADEPEVNERQIKAAVAKALPLLQKGAAGHAAQRSCFSCHHQGLPVLAMSVARERGFTVDEDGFRKQLAYTHNILAQWAKRTTDHRSFLGGQADTAGYALLTLELGDWKADETTAAVTEYLLLRNKELDYWRNVSNRPPSEASPFTTTALALRGLKAYGTPEQAKRITRRVTAARDWLLRTAPRDTEERVFRLWGLKYAETDADEVANAVQDLLRTQRPDGGWSQTKTLESDAYATGSALVALHLAGGLPVGDRAYQRGASFLVRKQLPDGSWLVRSRSKPFQTYFETGFPHGKDQWIASAASGWAAAALALTCPSPIGPPQEEPDPLPATKD
jgi:hypothetical protein